MSQQYLYAQQSVELYLLQKDISQLESHFLRWKQCLLRLPSVKDAQKLQIGQQILVRLNNIFQSVGQFCFKFQKQMVNLQDKLNSIILKNSTVNDKFQHVQFTLVMKKVQSLQKQLKATKQRGNKLQQALNALMNKQLTEQTTKNQLKQVKSSHQLSMAYGEQSFTYNLPLHCTTKSSKTNCGEQKWNNKHNKNQGLSNIYLSNTLTNNFETSSRSNPFLLPKEDQSQFIRTLSIENKHKYSLKHVPILNKQQNFSQTINRQDSLGFNRSTSNEKHQHRLDFMMKYLGQ